MSDTPVATLEPDVDQEESVEVPWVVLVWNDPINTMDFVTFVFQKVFGFSKSKAETLMWDVHRKGKAAVYTGDLGDCERHMITLQNHGLWATVEKS